MKEQSRSKYDFGGERVISNVLYFDTGKKTKIMEMSSFITKKDELSKIRAFGNDLVNKYKVILEDVEENIKRYDNLSQ